MLLVDFKKIRRHVSDDDEITKKKRKKKILMEMQNAKNPWDGGMCTDVSMNRYCNM